MTYPKGTILIHRNRGQCVFTEQCKYLQDRNPDPNSIFVEFDGEISEVTLQLVSVVAGPDPVLFSGYLAACEEYPEAEVRVSR